MPIWKLTLEVNCLNLCGLVLEFGAIENICIVISKIILELRLKLIMNGYLFQK